MDSRWIKHFKANDSDAKEKLNASLNSAKSILNAAIVIIEEQKAAIERPTKDDYDCPSWSHRQAHSNGEIAALNKVIKLLTIKG